MNTQNIDKSKKAKNKSTEIKTDLVTNEASINTTANQPHQSEFTLDIIELLDGKVNKNIVFFGFLILIQAIDILSLTCKDSGFMISCRPELSNVSLIIILFLYWTYLMVKHRLILKSLILLILFFISYLLF